MDAIVFQYVNAARPISGMPLPIPTFLMPQAMPAYLADLVLILDGFECLAEPKRFVKQLARRKRFARLEDVAIADVVGVDAHLFGESIEQPFDGERSLVAPNPRIAPQGGLLV